MINGNDKALTVVPNEWFKPDLSRFPVDNAAKVVISLSGAQWINFVQVYYI